MASSGKALATVLPNFRSARFCSKVREFKNFPPHMRIKLPINSRDLHIAEGSREFSKKSTNATFLFSRVSTENPFAVTYEYLNVCDKFICLFM